MSGSWKPLKTDPGAGTGAAQTRRLGLGPPPPSWGLTSHRLTFLHLPGELVELQQGRHADAQVLLQDSLHGHTPPTQAEVEVSKPEHPVEAGGDVGWGTNRKHVSPPSPGAMPQ